MMDLMASKLLASIVLVVACRGGERSTPEPSSKAHDAGTLRRVALSRPDDDVVAFERSTFRGQNRDCKLGTLIRLHPESETPPAPEVLSVDAFAIDRRTVSCFDFDRCIETGHCAGSSRLTPAPLVSRGNFCSSGNAIVSHEAAEEYCRWRGMSLPALFQWQRAIRGVEGMEFPSGHELAANKMELREVESPEGVIYSSERTDNREWLRDRDCIWFKEGGADATLQFVAMNLSRRLDFWSGEMNARFRCVRTTEASAGLHDGGTAP
jgi:formylglycine-generating enzyme required for sulfatase activity